MLVAPTFVKGMALLRETSAARHSPCPGAKAIGEAPSRAGRCLLLPPPRCGLGLTGRWRDGQGDLARESLRPGVERDDREPARPRAPPTSAPSMAPNGLVRSDSPRASPAKVPGGGGTLLRRQLLRRRRECGQGVVTEERAVCEQSLGSGAHPPCVAVRVAKEPHPPQPCEDCFLPSWQEGSGWEVSGAAACS